MELSYLQLKERPCVFIHGSGGNKAVWEYQLREVGGIAIDLPGHGESSDDPNILTVDDYARYVIQFIKEKLKKAYVIGHSLGGAIAQSVYLQDKDVVKGIVLIGSGARLRVLTDILKGLRENFEQTSQNIVNMLFCETYENLKIKQNVLNHIRSCGSRITFRDFNACDKFDLLEKYKNREIKIEVPMLCIVGDKDVLTPPKYAFFYQDIVGAQVKVIQDAGHMVMIEKFKEVNDVLDKFLT